VRSLRCVAVLAVMIATALTASASARDPRLVPVKAGQTGFGAFQESFTVPAAAGLRAAFGEPETVSSPMGFTCLFGWPSLGIYNVELAAFGGTTDACTNGSFISAVLTDPSWHTPRGVHPGGPAKAAKKQAVAKCARKVSCQGGGWVLGMHHSECAAAKVPSVVARVSGALVARLVVFSHGCE
jgi:hypothetical protein